MKKAGWKRSSHDIENEGDFDDVLGCGEGEHVGGRSEGRCSVVFTTCMANPLWGSLMGKPKE